MSLDREAAIAREDAEYLDAAAHAAAARLVSRTPSGVELDADALLLEPPAIARRVIRLAQQMAAGAERSSVSMRSRPFCASRCLNQQDSSIFQGIA